MCLKSFFFDFRKIEVQRVVLVEIYEKAVFDGAPESFFNELLELCACAFEILAVPIKDVLDESS